jgi:hypothetical protein
MPRNPKSKVVIRAKRPLDIPHGSLHTRFFAEGKTAGKTKVSIAAPLECANCHKACNVVRSDNRYRGMVCDACVGL